MSERARASRQASPRLTLSPIGCQTPAPRYVRRSRIMRSHLLPCLLGALVAACAPTAKTPIYARSDVAREAAVQKTIARGGAASEVAPPPSPSAAFSGTSAALPE